MEPGLCLALHRDVDRYFPCFCEPREHTFRGADALVVVLTPQCIVSSERVDGLYRSSTILYVPVCPDRRDCGKLQSVSVIR